MAQFTNQAFLSYGNIVTPSNIAVGEIVESLSATKTAVSREYSSDDTVTYVVSINNSGSVPYTALSISDNLGAYEFNQTTLVPLNYVENTVLYYVNGILQPTPSVSGTDSLIISGINVPAGGNAIIIYETLVNSFAPLAEGSTIENIVTISGSGIVPFEASETITAISEPNLTITKSISPNPVSANGVVTYTFVLQNTGSTPLVATDNAVITDLFDPILSNISVSFNGVAWTEGTNYTYNEATGEFATIESQIVVDGATFTQDPTTGLWSTTPSVATLVVSGNI